LSHIYSFLLEKLITNMFDSLKPIPKKTARQDLLSGCVIVFYYSYLYME